MTLSIFDAARENPDGIGLIHRATPVSFAELAAGAARSVETLSGRGLVPVVASAERETLELLYGLFARGLPALLLDPRSSESERRAITESAGTVEDDTLVLVPTSGTSGVPELVALPRAAFIFAAKSSERNLGWLPKDRWLACLPLWHVGGLSVVVRCLLARKPVVLAEGSDPAELSRLMNAEHVTLASLVPTQLARWIAHPSFVRPRALRAALVGGAGASPELLSRARNRGVPALATYGMTETAGQVATQRPGDDDVFSVGRPLDGYEVRIDGERVAVRPPWREDFVQTDDFGRFDSEGRLVIVGRSADRIVTGGENVDPLEVERVLERFPGVLRACVVGVADALWGERVVAAIVANEGFDSGALEAFAARELSPHKRPRRVFLCEDLPLLASGKPDRRRLSRALAEGSVVS